MTAQVYQIRDYQPRDTRLRLLQIDIEKTANEIAILMRGMGFCAPVIIDNEPCEMNPDDCA